jgi:broad specificity phosphatase PhoE
MRRRFAPNGDPDDPVRRRLPGMETWAEMYQRVGNRLREAALEFAGGCIVVVAHGGTVGASFVTLAGATLVQGITITRATINTSITEWHYDGFRWSLIRENEAKHLAQH